MVMSGIPARASGANEPSEIVGRRIGNVATLSNDRVELSIDSEKQSITITDPADGQVVLSGAWVAADRWGSASALSWKGWTVNQTIESVAGPFGDGKRIVVELSNSPHPSAPAYLFSYTLHKGSATLVMGFGMRNTLDYAVRLMSASPIAAAKLMPAASVDHLLTLNGSAGAEAARVQAGTSRTSPNSLMLTCIAAGRRRSLVWGGLANKEFGKYASLTDSALELSANDPVGRLVDAGETYWAEDTFYLDAITADPFDSLEQYGRAMRLANHASPNVYDFPVLCGWGVGALSHLPAVNNSEKLVGELEAAQKAGVTKYTKVAIRLEPDHYCYDTGNTEQGWWDDKHWAQYGHLVPPYDTFDKWCDAIRERDGIPYTYFQMGMPSDDYARAFPGHMLFKDISRLQVAHPHHQPLVSYDYTAQDFQKRTLTMWKRLRKDGIRGIKFDYPETAWRPEGGFEDPHATTAFAYREAFRLAREGLGADSFLDERNLGESGRPCLDVTAGLIDTQRSWADSNAFVPAMISIDGLRWYKNRTVFNYYPDSKTVHDCTPEVRQAMLTMVFLTSGRIDLATSFTLFTPEIVHDFTRIYPAYPQPFTARPLDAFTGVADPQVYDLELTPDWHQVALFNTSGKAGIVTTPLSGDRTSTGAIGLDADAAYYVYDFWSDKLVGKYPGTASIARDLGPSHCAMLSVRKAQPNPQVLSTNRHVLQGWVDLQDVAWDGNGKRLTGSAKVIGGESLRITLANNGHMAGSVSATGCAARLEQAPEGDLSIVVLDRPDNGDCRWQVSFV